MIADIDFFMAHPDNRIVNLSGTITLDLPALDIKNETFPIEGGATLTMLDATPDATDPGGTKKGGFRYRLPFSIEGHPYEWRGFKVFHDDPGMDAWLDATCLYSRIVDVKDERTITRGIVRVSMADFLGKQIAGMRAEGPSDPVARAWAVSRFGLYFFGEMQKVFLPEMQRLLDLVHKPQGPRPRS